MSITRLNLLGGHRLRFNSRRQKYKNQILINMKSLKMNKLTQGIIKEILCLKSPNRKLLLKMIL